MEALKFNFGNLEATSQEAFDQYHSDNPKIYEKLLEFAFEAKRSGISHLGIGMLYERLRWYTSVEARNDAFKLNNNYRAFYARKMMSECPELIGLFETRKSKADVQ